MIDRLERFLRIGPSPKARRPRHVAVVSLVVCIVGTGTSAAQLLQAKGEASTYWDSPNRRLVTAAGTHDLAALALAEAFDLHADERQWTIVGQRHAGEIATGELRDLVVVRGDGEGVTDEHPLPPGSAARHSPVLLAEGLLPGGELRRPAPLGLAWIQGGAPASREIWVSSWSGERFETPRRIVGRGPGSQVALDGATLTDGRVLLVWSRFDGNDTDLFFSVASPAGELSEPARVATDDDSPDLTPTVAALPGGRAIVAWSSFDGDSYRVVAATFDGDRFSPSAAIGPPGSVRPRFTELAYPTSQARLLLREAAPSAWQALDLRVPAGAQEPPRPIRAGRLLDARSDAPLVIPSGRGAGRGVVFAWPAPPGANEPLATMRVPLRALAEDPR